MSTLTELVKRDGIIISHVQDEGRSVKDGWEHNAFTVTLERAGLAMSLPFMHGTGIEGVPEVDNVMASLVMEAQSFENSGDDSMDALDRFVNWCEEYGFEASSAHVKTFRAVEESSAKLEAFLGGEYLEYLLCEVDV